MKKLSAEEFFALPAGGGFNSEKRVIDGVTVLVPAPANDIAPVWVPDDHPICYHDATGRAWRLGKFKDGSYGRMPFGW